MRVASVSLIAILFSGVGTYLYSNSSSQTGTLDLNERVAELETHVKELERSVVDLHLSTKLEGHWVEDKWIRDGEEVVQSLDAIEQGFGGPVEWRLSSDADTQRWLLAAEPEAFVFGTFKLDTTKDPIWIDFERGKGDQKRVIRGIMRYSYKQVWISIPGDLHNQETSFGQPRATSFDSTAENGYSVFRLQRKSFDRSGVF